MKARYYSGANPIPEDVEVSLRDGRIEASPPVFPAVDARTARIASRIGDTPRAIYLPSGAVIETDEHATVDSWQAELGQGRNLAHHFERRMGLALAALAFVVFSMVGGAVYGVPWVANLIAHALPPSVEDTMGAETLAYLDRLVFKESALDAAKHRELQAMLQSAAGDDRVMLEVRAGGAVGANAFALPGGIIVVTDELVALASDDELTAVMLHEVGHVAHRHGLRRVVSHAGLAALSVVVFGDVSGAGTLVLALPNVLMESSYSRAMETEADTYALTRMRDRGLPPEAFATLLEKLSGPDDSRFAYLMSHPPTADRVSRFRED